MMRVIPGGASDTKCPQIIIKCRPTSTIALNVDNHSYDHPHGPHTHLYSPLRHITIGALDSITRYFEPTDHAGRTVASIDPSAKGFRCRDAGRLPLLIRHHNTTPRVATLKVWVQVNSRIYVEQPVLGERKKERNIEQVNSDA